MNDSMHDTREHNTEKARRGERTISQSRSVHSAPAKKNNTAQAVLLLAPLNLFCLVLAALAVVGICALARNSANALPPDDSDVYAAAAGDVTGGVDDVPGTSQPQDTAGAVQPPVVTDLPQNDAPETSAPITDVPVTDAPVTGVPSADIPPVDAGMLHAEYDISSGLLGSSIVSDYAILVDLQTNKVLASKNSNVRMYPASMTKVMTLYVAALYIPEADMYTKTFQMTNDIITPLYYANATRAGFVGGEDVLLIDYMYGTILPSGADSTIALATYIAGGEEEFAELMNKVAGELGLENTHFTNSTGLHDPDHYTTAYDMSVIMRAAMQNELCCKVLSTLLYTTNSTAQNPSGIALASTALSRLSPYDNSKITYIAGKTGFTDEAKQCLVSVAQTADGNRYLMVCGHADAKYDAISDTVDSYERYCRIDQ